MSSLRRATAAVLVASLVVGASVASAASTATAAGGEGRSGATPTTTPTRPPKQVVAALQSLSGVRPASTTVLAGALLNQTDGPVDATVTLSDLPAGTSISAARPDATNPDPADPAGPVWSCHDLTCDLVDSTGAARQLAAGASVGLVLALTGDGLRPGQSATITVGDGRPHEVRLDRAEDAPAIGDEAMSVAIAGSTALEAGTDSSLQVTVANLGTTTAPAGTVVVAIPSPAVVGTSITATGAGWSCGPTSCTAAGPLAPLAATAPLTLTTAVPVATTGDGTLTVAATATGTALAGRGELAQWVDEPLTHDVSIRFGTLPQRSISAPSTQELPVIVTPVGRSDGATSLRDPVSITLDVEAHVTVDWDAARSAGPWRCSASARSCTSSAPLPAGVPSLVRIPVTYETDAEAGLSTIAARARTAPVATIGPGAPIGGNGPTEADAVPEERTDSTSTTIVVNPPPVAGLRATMAASPANPASSPGAPLAYPVGASRPLTIDVLNHGSRPAPAGSTVEVVARSDVTEHVQRAGGDGWRCAGFDADGSRADGVREIGGRRPLRCRTTLRDGLAPEARLTLPVTLAPSDVGTSAWTVGTSLDGHNQEGELPTFRIDTDSDVAHVVPRLAVDHGLVRDGVGSVDLTLTNRGMQAADGSVLVVDLPEGVDVADVAGDGWTCADGVLGAARGSLTCSTVAQLAPGATSTPVRMELTVSGAETDDADEVSIWLWATAPGQRHPSAERSGSTVDLPVHPEEAVSAGDDLTVISPVPTPQGPQPATVLLRGEASGSLAREVRWTQLCTAAGQPDCDGVAPAVTWLGVPAGQSPTTAVARFVAPAIPGPTTLRFRLTASNGGPFVRSSDVEVHLVPAASRDLGASVAASGSGRAGPAGRGPTATPSGRGGTATVAVPSGTGPSAPGAVAVAVGDGSTLQVPTGDSAVLSAVASGTAPFTWRWTQTDGTDAEVLSGATGPDLTFVAPDLDPDATSQDLTFAVTVTDALGRTATADGDVQVVWGDDGLQVQLAGGTDDVAARAQSPVTVTSQVSSRGAPYSYAWSVSGGDVTLPAGTDTDASSLSFTAPSEPGETTVQLKVTDSFGRVAVESIPLDVTELPAGAVPVALCRALSSLQGGQPAALGGATGDVAVVITAATVDDVAVPSQPTTTTSSTSTTTSTTTTTTTTSPPAGRGSTTTTPGPGCGAASQATFDAATVALPGGIAVTGASGELSLVGVLVHDGTITVPANWGPVALSVPDDGLLLPFLSATDPGPDSIGVPTGSLQGPGVPFTAPAGWTGSTTVTFPASGSPEAAIDAAAAPTSDAGSGHLSISGSAGDAGATVVRMQASGLVGVGPVDVPVAGSLTTTDAASPTTSSVTGSLSARTPLSSDVSLADTTLDWSPAATTGSTTLDLGASTTPLSVTAAVTIDTASGGGAGDDATFEVGSPGQSWQPFGADGPELRLVGTGSVSDGATATGAAAPQLHLQLGGAPAAPWIPAASLVVSGLVPVVAASCTLSTSTACNPTASLEGSVVVGAPVGTGTSTPLTGSYAPATGSTTLTSSVGVLDVAPLAVADARLAISGNPGRGAVPTAAGSASILGAPRSTTVTFGADAVVAAAGLGGYQPIPGWTLQGTTALAATATTTYRFAPTDGIAAQTVTVQPGTLTGAAVTTMPIALSSGVLPDDVTSGAATFPIGPDPDPASIHLAVAAPAGWYVLGSEDSTTGTDPVPSLQVTSISYDVAVAGEDVTVSASGTGTMTTPAIDGTDAGAVPPLTFTGGLTTGSTGGAGSPTGAILDLDFSAATGGPWSAPFGAGQLSVTNTVVQSTITAGSAYGIVSGDVAIGDQLGTVLGTGTGGGSLSARFGDGATCPVVDLSGTGIDPGGLGLMATPSASLVVTPTSCALATGSAEPGLTLDFSVPMLASASLAIDPTTSAVDETLTDLSATIDGLALSDTALDISTTPAGGPGGAPSVGIDVSGQAQLAGQALALSGSVVGPTSAAPVPSLQLATTGTDTREIDLGSGLAVDPDGLAVSLDAVPGPGTPSITVAGTTSFAGSPDVGVWLQGQASSSEITALLGCLTGVGGTAPTAQTPNPCASLPTVTFPLPGSGPTEGQHDSLSTSVGISYVASGAESITITTPSDAVLVAGGYTFDGSTVTFDDGGFDVTTSAGVPGSPFVPVALQGSYTTAATPSTPTGVPGDFTLSSPTQTPLTFSGFSVASTVTFARKDGTASATIDGQMAPGLFDDDTTVELRGDIAVDPTSGQMTTTLTGAADDVELRGLDGTATFTVSPGSGSPDALTAALGAQGWYQTKMAFDPAADSCALWSNAPKLDGEIYRNGGTTYYTLTGTADLQLGTTLDIADDTQPLVLSNEWVGAGSNPANGITLTATFHAAALQIFGTVSIAPGTCSYSISGTVVFNPAGSALGDELSNVLTPPTGLSYQSSGLFSGGDLPPNIEVVRTAMEYQALQSELQVAYTAALARSSDATQNLAAQTANLTAAQQALTDATDELEQSTQALQEAMQQYQDAYGKAVDDLVNGPTELSDEELATNQQAVYDAEDAVAVAAAQVRAQTATVDDAGNDYSNASENLDQAADQADSATSDLATATDDLVNTPVTTMLTFDLTHCDTCDPPDSASIGGEFFFDVIYVAGVDLDVGWSSEGWDSISGSFSFGIQKTIVFGDSHIGADASATGTVDAEIAYSFVTEEVTQLQIGVDLSAQLSAYVSCWLFSYTANLLDVALQGAIDIVPSATISGSLEVSLWGYDIGGHFGPDPL